MIRAARMTALAAAALAVAGCGDDATSNQTVDSTAVAAVTTDANGAADSAADVSPRGAYADFWQAIDDTGTDIQGALFFKRDPISDVQVPIDMYVVTEAALEELMASLPAEVDEMAGEQLDAFAVYVQEWLATAAQTRARLEAERVDLQAANDDYLASEVDGSPPLAYTELIDQNFAAAEGFGTVCVEMATKLDIGPDCFRMLAAPGGPDGSSGEVEDVGVVGIELGELRGEVDIGPALETLIEPGFVGIDLGPRTTFTITEPPAVADPDDLGEAIVPMPWPDDVPAWLELLPVEVVETSTVDLAGNEFERITFRQESTDAVAVIANPYWPDGEGAYVLRGGETVVVWDGGIDGQAVVGVLWSSDPAPDVESFVQRSEEILMSVAPV